MEGNKDTNRLVNLFNLATAAGVFASGLILFFEFHVSDGSERLVFAGATKSVWVNVHRGMAVSFVCGYAVHITFHWKFIANIARRWGSGLSKKIKKTSREQIALAAASLIVLIAGFYAWAALSGSASRGTELRHHWIDVHNIIGLALLAGLSVHIKRRWRRLFPPRKRASVKAPTLDINAVPRRGMAQLILHNPFGRHTMTPYIRVDTHKCTACRACATGCKHGVLEIIDIRIHSHVHVRRADQCRGCMQCLAVCANHAFTRVLGKAANE